MKKVKVETFYLNFLAEIVSAVLVLRTFLSSKGSYFWFIVFTRLLSGRIYYSLYPLIYLSWGLILTIDQLVFLFNLLFRDSNLSKDKFKLNTRSKVIHLIKTFDIWFKVRTFSQGSLIILSPYVGLISKIPIKSYQIVLQQGLSFFKELSLHVLLFRFGSKILMVQYILNQNLSCKLYWLDPNDVKVRYVIQRIWILNLRSLFDFDLTLVIFVQVFGLVVHLYRLKSLIYDFCFRSKVFKKSLRH